MFSILFCSYFGEFQQNMRDICKYTHIDTHTGVLHIGESGESGRKYFSKGRENVKKSKRVAFVVSHPEK